MDLTDIQKKNIDTVQTALKNAFAANFDVLKPLIDDDFVIFEAEGLPFGGVFRGMAGYIQCMKGIAEFWTGNSIAPPEFIPIGDDRVLMMSTFTGKIRKNGQHVEMPTLSTWRFKNGRIAEVRPYFFDTKKIADLAAL